MAVGVGFAVIDGEEAADEQRGGVSGKMVNVKKWEGKRAAMLCLRGVRWMRVQNGDFLSSTQRTLQGYAS